MCVVCDPSIGWLTMFFSGWINCSYFNVHTSERLEHMQANNKKSLGKNIKKSLTGNQVNSSTIEGGKKCMHLSWSIVYVYVHIIQVAKCVKYDTWSTLLYV